MVSHQLEVIIQRQFEEFGCSADDIQSIMFWYNTWKQASLYLRYDMFQCMLFELLHVFS